MADRPLNMLVRHIRRMAGDTPEYAQSDRVLLAKFIAQRDEDAFTMLVQRHGPMVRGVCQRLLGRSPDVDDAFQATFLILVRKASSIHNGESLASWLYGVAYRVARGLRNGVARREGLKPEPVQRTPDDPGLQAAWRELCALLDEEVRRLSDRYRAPLVLCYLEGQTRDQAARQLGWSLRTLDRRLTQGREVLRARLARRGLTLSAGLLATCIAEQAASATLPAALFNSTLKAAALVAEGKQVAMAASGPVAVLVQGGIRAMIWTKLQAAAFVTLIAAGIAGAGVLFSVNGAPGQSKEAPDQAGAQHEAVTSTDNLSADPAQDAAVRPPVSRVGARQAAARAKSMNNLKQIALAMHNYHDTYTHFPPPAIYSQAAQPSGSGGAGGAGAGIGSSGGSSIRGPVDAAGSGAAPIVQPRGRALLSWRVAILPFIEQDALYKQFHLTESWDSPHNKELLAQMPAVYAPTGGDRKDDSTSTYYQVFVGPQAGFEKHRAFRIVDIIDGTSNTIMAVEAGRAVPWTKPEDLAFDPDEPLPALGGILKDSIRVAMFDGSVQTITADTNELLIRAAVTRNGGEAIDLNNMFARTASGGGGEGRVDHAGLREENQKLLEYRKQAKEILEQLKAELKTAQDGQDKETAKLLDENRRLQQEILKLREEAEKLSKQLQQARQGKSGTRKF